MYLKTIYIQGFKSFANRTKIEFNKRITGIVGPNGSGKSNISDAIMWVLGESSAKNLRGSKMEDVIFSGTDDKKALSLAEVTIVLDNSDETLPIKYTEVSVTRRMYRSGETEYLINNVKCRLKDVKELFLDTGIGKDGYSLIGQGKTESILSSKPEQRRAVFEEAAGISKYKLRKTESENKLKKTEDNIIRLNDIITEIDSREKALKIESERAKKYRELYNELKKFEIEDAFLKIEYEESKNLKTTKETELLENEINELKHGIETHKALRDSCRAEFDNLQKSMGDKHEILINLNNIIEKSTSRKAIIKNKQENISNNIKSKVDNINELKSKSENLEEAKKTFGEDLQKIQDELLKLNENLEKQKSIFNVKNKSLTDIEEDLKKHNENLLALNKEKSELDSKIILVQSLIKDRQERIDSIDRNLKILEDNKKEISDSINYENALLGKTSEEKNSIIKKLDNLKEEKNDCSNKIEVHNNKLSELHQNINKYEARFSVLKNITENYEGYNKSVKTFMNLSKSKNLFGDELLGPVAENIKVDKEYERAISVALGFGLQNIIIKSNKDAKKMIDFLIENKIGRVTFLPIDSIKDNNPKIDLNSYGVRGVLGFADKFVKSNENIVDVIKYLLGKIIIAEDFDSAELISKKTDRYYRVVSLKGDSFNVGGSLTGGFVSKDSSDIISRNSELEKLKNSIRELKIEYNDILKNKSKLTKNLDDKSFLMEELEGKLESLNKKLFSVENNIVKLTQSNKSNEEYILRYNSEKEHLMENIKSENINLDSFILNLENINTKLNKRNTEIEKDEKVSYLKVQLEELRNCISNLKVELVKLNLKKEFVGKELKNSIENITQNREKLTLLKKDIEIGENQLEELREECKKEEKAIVDKSEEKKEVEEDYNNLNKRTKELDIKITEILKKLDELRELLSDKEKRYVKLEALIENKEVKIAGIKEKIFDKYSFIIKDENREKLNISKGELNTNIKALTDKLNNLGDVNLHSIADYEETLAKLNFNLEQKNDLMVSRQEILDVLGELEIEMKEMFKKTFIKVSKYFDEIFKILFNGGKAQIELDSSNILEGGVDIKAQPPGKKFQSLSLLSGGERALTAVALIFALLKVRPAPFCILDEIDAALDDANILRYADYVKKIPDIQFIIITHRKLTMEIVNVLYGVTMEEKGISKLISVELKK
ncbi:putative SMC family, C-domain protein [Peptoniphilus sp. ING2-D1G]|nr:putative SMC family, C-domain protein [Peptoniphilus sp. ING2-D1G]